MSIHNKGIIAAKPHEELCSTIKKGGLLLVLPNYAIYRCICRLYRQMYYADYFNKLLLLK